MYIGPTFYINNKNFFNYISDFGDGLRVSYYIKRKVCYFILNYLSTTYMQIVTNYMEIKRTRYFTH
jgi:lipid-A-disaccharide synthase-like uncharacterized protein